MKTIPIEEAVALGLIAKKTRGGNPDERRFPFRAVAGPFDATPTDDRLFDNACKTLPEDSLIVNDRGARTIYRPAAQVKLGKPGRKEAA